ncbi:fimbrial protein [Pseudomonas sp. Q1-7]|uniref:fimbrial protein n=1 Tax=Pseudomonas sp. Q1-7 TaxID=3020843 RepID=UPI002301C255|nr:fimbrial protein [Pseudomonas sp. Q1-7]
MAFLASPLRHGLLSLGLLIGLPCAPGLAEAACRPVWPYSAHETANGNLGLPAVTLNADSLQPAGTVLGMATISVARNANVNPETVAYECLPSDGPFYEYFSTNGSDALSGRHEVSGMPGHYYSPWRNVAVKITHVQSNRTFSRTWQRRQIAGELNPATGRVEIKARDFSDVTVELVKLDDTQVQPGLGEPTEGLYSHAQPNGYIAFQGGGLSPGLSPGCDHAAGCTSGKHQHWPAAIGLWNHTHLTRQNSCMVRSATPVVDLGRMTATELKNGGARQASFGIDIECSGGVTAGHTGRGLVEVGLQVSQNSEQALRRHHPEQVTTSGGAQVLLSDGYGSDPGVATGVGIRILDRNHSPLVLAGWAPRPTGGQEGGSGTSAGWYPLLQTFQANGTGAQGAFRYSGQFSAAMVPLAPRVTPGRVDANATVVVRIH